MPLLHFQHASATSRLGLPEDSTAEDAEDPENADVLDVFISGFLRDFCAVCG